MSLPSGSKKENRVSHPPPTQSNRSVDRLTEGSSADILFILVISFIGAFLILWAGSSLFQARLSALPNWITGSAKWVASIMSGTALLSGIGSYLMTSNRRPAYLKAIMIITPCLVLAIIGVFFLSDRIGPQNRVPELTISFVLDPDDTSSSAISSLAISQSMPWDRNPQRVDRVHDFDTDKFPYNAPYPNLGQVTRGEITPVSEESQKVSGQPHSDFCFAPAPSFDGSRRSGRLICHLGKPCEIDSTSQEIMLKCQQNATSNLSLISSAMAQTGQAYWVVPGLDTLSNREGDKYLGYTLFSLASDDFDWGGAEYYSLAIRANGQPLWFDGIPPERQTLELPSKPGSFYVRFPIENLNFSGRQKGCEEIEAKLTLFGGKGGIRTINIRRSYVALRNPPDETISLRQGGHIRWSGRYVPQEGASRRDRLVFVASYVDGDSAENGRNAFNNRHLQFNGNTLQGVIRPPFKENTHYGLVVGQLEPTEQIRFLFLPDIAEQVVSAVKNSGYPSAFVQTEGVRIGEEAYMASLCPAAAEF